MTATVVVLIILLLLALGLFIGLIASFRRPGPGEALVISSSAGVRISRQPCFVPPFTARVERLALTSIPFHVECVGGDGVVFADNIRGDLILRAGISLVDDTAVLQLVRDHGLEHVRNEAFWAGVLHEPVVEALHGCGRSLDFADAYSDLVGFQARLVKALEGALAEQPITLEAIQVELHRTPLDHLDPENVHDQECIRVTQAEMAKCRRESYRVIGANRRFLKGSTVSLGIHPADVETWMKAANGGGPL